MSISSSLAGGTAAPLVEKEKVEAGVEGQGKGGEGTGRRRGGEKDEGGGEREAGRQADRQTKRQKLWRGGGG